MASTAHKTPQEIEEHFDEPEEIERKLDTLADWVQSSKHFTAFTGAGISTSAGIPDFRGPEGVWTRTARGEEVVHGRNFLCARPTEAHMALLTLWKHGILRSLLSTNTDGLHLRSGFPRTALTELHGNTNLEVCSAEPLGASKAPYGGDGCGAEFFRDERVRADGLTAHEHATGRKCENCGKPLQDTVINFNENLRSLDFEAGWREADACDLLLCLGSSLRVSTWAPEEVTRHKHKRLVIVNLQWTPLDEAADLKINARTDTVLGGLCARLGVEPMPWQIRRRVTVSTAPTDLNLLTVKQLKAMWCALKSEGKGFLLEKEEIRERISAELSTNQTDHRMLMVTATDDSGQVPYAFLKGIEVAVDGRVVEGSLVELPRLHHKAFIPIGTVSDVFDCQITIHTPGRYGEPPVVIQHLFGTEAVYSLIFSENGWTVTLDTGTKLSGYISQSASDALQNRGSVQAPTTEFRFPKCCLLRVAGHVDGVDMIGQLGRVQEFDEATSTYHIALGTKVCAITADNLQVLGHGEAIRIGDLVDNVELNGMLGYVKEFVSAKGRYTVELDGDRTVLLPNRCMHHP